jgi:hypothetical protein
VSGGINLAQLEAELAGTYGLRSGATGQPAHRDAAGDLAELRRAQRQRGWDDATVLLRDEAAAYREVYGTREQRDSARKQPGGSSFL